MTAPRIPRAGAMAPLLRAPAWLTAPWRYVTIRWRVQALQCRLLQMDSAIMAIEREAADAPMLAVFRARRAEVAAEIAVLEGQP